MRSHRTAAIEALSALGMLAFLVVVPLVIFVKGTS